MTLDTFLEITKTRLPSVPEMVGLCDSLNIQFGRSETGQPYIRPCPECRDEAMILVSLFKREPFRSQVIAAKLSETNGHVETKATEQPESDDEEPEPERIVPPAGAEIFVADAKGHINEHRKGEPYMWTWTGAKTWHYIRDHKPPGYGVKDD
jgi:hypothetical protein